MSFKIKIMYFYFKNDKKNRKGEDLSAPFIVRKQFTIGIFFFFLRPQLNTDTSVFSNMFLGLSYHYLGYTFWAVEKASIILDLVQYRLSLIV